MACQKNYQMQWKKTLLFRLHDRDHRDRRGGLRHGIRLNVPQGHPQPHGRVHLL